MGLFNKKNSVSAPPVAAPVVSDAGALAELALDTIHDGVLILDAAGQIRYINPAALKMADYDSAADALNLSYDVVLKFRGADGAALPDNENELLQALRLNQPLEKFVTNLATAGAKTMPINLSLVLSPDGASRIITFRDITKEQAEDAEKTEFISTASHEMRTPVASIEGYLGLAINPQTATIDERARGYLTAAHNAAKHLGKLFQDLLDVTKLDDGHIRAHLEPVEMVSLTKQLMENYAPAAASKRLNFQFGAGRSANFSEVRRVEQVVYSYVDVNFLRLILGNLIENALKYTPAGGSIYVNAVGEGDRVILTVTDTGIGIAAADLPHIFQKFYRVDNSDTRTIGGTGLGLYLVKQRAEALGGTVWAESVPGSGSTFFVSLPRLSGDEYEKRLIATKNGGLL